MTDKELQEMANTLDNKIPEDCGLAEQSELRDTMKYDLLRAFYKGSKIRSVSATNRIRQRKTSYLQIAISVGIILSVCFVLWLVDRIISGAYNAFYFIIGSGAAGYCSSLLSERIINKRHKKK